MSHFILFRAIDIDLFSQFANHLLENMIRSYLILYVRLRIGGIYREMDWFEFETDRTKGMRFFSFLFLGQ